MAAAGILFYHPARDVCCRMMVMDERASYGQFCPVSMAAEILCTRWTVLVLRELLCGT